VSQKIVEEEQSKVRICQVENPTVKQDLSKLRERHEEKNDLMEALWLKVRDSRVYLLLRHYI